MNKEGIEDEIIMIRLRGYQMGDRIESSYLEWCIELVTTCEVHLKLFHLNMNRS
jgi:hypothetical protein